MTIKLIICLLAILIATTVVIYTAVDCKKQRKKYQKYKTSSEQIKSKKFKIQHRSPFLKWLIEFSKKVVILCVILYTAVILYSAVAMWIFNDFYSLSTLISESSEVLRACVFGYMIKAGIENWQKIKKFSNNTE